MPGYDILLMSLAELQPIPADYIKTAHDNNHPLIVACGVQRIVVANAGSKSSPKWQQTVLTNSSENAAFFALSFPKIGAEPISATAKGNVATLICQTLFHRQFHRFEITAEDMDATHPEILFGLLLATIAKISAEENPAWREIQRQAASINEIVKQGMRALLHLGSHISTIKNFLKIITNDECPLYTMTLSKAPNLEELNKTTFIKGSWPTRKTIFLKEKMPVAVQYGKDIWIYGRNNQGEIALTSLPAEYLSSYRYLEFTSVPKSADLKVLPSNIHKHILRSLAQLGAHVPAVITITPGNLVLMKDLTIMGQSVHQYIVRKGWGIPGFSAAGMSNYLNEAAIGWEMQWELQTQLLVEKEKQLAAVVSEPVSLLAVASASSSSCRFFSVEKSKKPITPMQIQFFNLISEMCIFIESLLTSNNEKEKSQALEIKEWLLSPLYERYEKAIHMQADILGGDEAVRDEVDFLQQQIVSYNGNAETSNNLLRLLFQFCHKLHAIEIMLVTDEVPSVAPQCRG